MCLGAHFSIAGGLHKALERAADLGCDALQLFTHSTVQWRVKPLSAEEVRLFCETRAARGPFAVAVHACYLVNLASPDRSLRERSIRMMVRELERCETLGVPFLVFHPGAHMGAGEVRGLKRIAGALDRIHTATKGVRVKTVIENTAGQGSNLGWRFEQLACLCDAVGDAERLHICFDTAHAFAAGYDFRAPAAYNNLWAEIDRTVGLARVAVFHLNDSLTDAGTRVDRHAHIGQGKIGREPFRRILRDPRFRRAIKVIETPKKDDMDRRNLALLRRLAERRPGPLKRSR